MHSSKFVKHHQFITYNPKTHAPNTNTGTQTPVTNTIIIKEEFLQRGFLCLLLVHLGVQAVWRPGVAVVSRWVGCVFLLFHCFDLVRPIVVGVVIWGWCLLNVGLFWCIGFNFSFVGSSWGADGMASRCCSGFPMGWVCVFVVPLF